MPRRDAFLLVLLGLCLVQLAQAQTITEFTIPTAGSAPEGIAAGPDGNLWFTESSGNKIGRITPLGAIDEFAVPTSGSRPWGITAGPDGNLWFTENLEQGAFGGKIGRITTVGVITEFDIPTAGSCPQGIAAGPDGNLWFVEICTYKVGRITTDGVVTEFPTPSTRAASGPEWITAGSDGNLWYTGGANNKIGRVTPAGAITEFTSRRPLVIHSASRPAPTAIFGSRNTTTAKMGRITTDGVVTEFLNSLAMPYGIAAGSDGNLWFTERGSNGVWRLTPGGTGTRYTTPTLDSKPHGIASGPDGALWIAEFAANKIGRLSLEPTPCMANETSLCLSNQRFLVAASWRKSNGYTGNGQAVALTSDSGYFWFFNDANIEMVIKVLNACSIGGRYWVFAAGLTNVEVTLTVTDTHTNTQKAYLNPLDTAFIPIQDTSAFSTCP